MPWYFPWSDSIKKRACRYLLQHYVGQFLQEKLTLDQLSVDLFNGKGIVKDVPLDVWALNELLEGANVPLEILDGFIHTIAVSVPWSSLMQENCQVEVKGLEIVVAIKKNVDVDGGSVTSESLFSSMTTSLQIAQECLKDNEPAEDDAVSQQTFDGLESFAQTIESVLSRIKVSFEDVLIRFEHLFRHKKSGVGLELHIKRIDYSDLSSDVSTGEQSNYDVYEPPSLANKQLRIYGMKLSLDEFHETSQTVLRNASGKVAQTPSPESVTSSPPISPYQSAVFNQSLVANHLSRPSLLPAVVVLSSAGEQEANVKWKVNPSPSAGSKVEFKYFLGTLNVLLSPKQLHVLLELMEDINTLSNTDTYLSTSQGVTNKPMKPDDFQRIEKELREQMSNEKKQSKVDMWNTHFDNTSPVSLESQPNTLSSEEETFYSLTDEDHELPGNESSVKTNVYPYAQSLVKKVSEAGIVPLCNTSTDDHRNGPLLSKLNPPNPGLAAVPGLDDDNLTNGSLEMSGLSITLLLQDPQTAGQSECSTSQDHVLCKIADRFFDRMSSTAFGSKDVEVIQDKFNKACLHSHLRCFFTTVGISGEVSTTSSCQCVTTEVTVGLASMIECLVDEQNADKATMKPKLTQILSLSGREEELPPVGKFLRSLTPCLKAKYKSIQRSSSPASIQGRHCVVPKTEIDVQLGDAKMEVDLTIIDRLHDVMHPSYSSTDQPKQSSQYFASAPLHTDANEQALFSRTMTDGSSCEQKIQIHVQCPSLSASLRFPILDLRSSNVRLNPPLWEKNLRKEICLLRCSDFAFETCLQDSEAAAMYEMRFKTLNGYWKFCEESDGVHFIRVSQRHADNDDGANSFDLARIVVSAQPVSGPVLEEVSSGDSSPDSLSDTCPMLKQEPSPFSSKPLMYDKEELVVPGDPSEMKHFQEKTSVLSKLHIELNFPEIDVNLQDPVFFELIYNRFGNDLLLWEPSTRTDVKKAEYNVLASNWIGVDVASSLKGGKNVQNSFQMCRSAVNHDSYSSDEDDSDISEQQKILHTTEKKPNSTLALTLNSSKLRITMFPRTKIESGDGYGKILLYFDNAQLFYVLDYKGEPNLCYISSQAQYCSLHHAIHVDEVARNMDTVFDLGDLYRTIYESDPGVKVSGSKTNLNNDRAMLSLAVKSLWDVDRNSKDIVIALSLCGGTIRHRMVNEGQMWLLQIIDYFGVTDEEVVGYIPPVVVTMLHVHFWDCALHYRPLYIPYQILITTEGFSISSNITLDSKTSILRFLMDNAVLLISNTKDETMNIVKDYVSVADVDLFELSINTVNDEEKDSPKLTMTLSNNIVHVRTCSDSLSAVLDVVRYFVNDGDLSRDTTIQTTDVVNGDIRMDQEEIFDDSPVEQRNPEDGCLHDLMSDAMAESPVEKHGSDGDATQEPRDDTHSKTDVFLFPDESQITSSQEQGNHPLDSVNQDDESSDEDFCILDHPQKEQEVIYDEPKVKCTGDEIRIIPDHFSKPVGGVDQLKAPSNYPTPLYVYTVKEMSVLWQLYGGNDFQTNSNNTRNNHYARHGSDNGRTFQEDDDVDDVPVVIGNRGNKKKSSSTKINWKTTAGQSRDLNTLVEVQLSKVRFQYEEYPAETKQAWRQVLLIQDVEIRDRLSSSQINKLLYQYSTEARPKQTHANMVSMKVLGLRPDDGLSSQEGCLRISLKPLRLNIDQDTLQFLINFCKDLSEETNVNEAEAITQVAVTSSSPEHAVENNMEEAPAPTASSSNHDAPIFFRLVEFSPDVPIRLDYHGKHMDMGQRSLAGLLFAFAQLNCSEITLRRLCHRSGLMGFDRVVSYALNEWANDIKKRQIPGILGGVGPTYSFVQLVQGVKDLFWLPVEQYRRDGRIMRGLQRGASSFTTSSAMAFIELTNKLVQVVHGAAEVAYDMVSPTDNLPPGSHGKLIKRRVNSEPADLRQGIANAYNVVTEGFGKTASNIVQVAKEEHESKGMTGAVGGVLRHIPSAVVQPIILATEATSNVLGGVRNQILPDARREAAEKWRVEEQ